MHCQEPLMFCLSIQDGSFLFFQTGLQPCKIYDFRLRSRGLNTDGDILWTFPTAKTLPKLDVEISSKHKALGVKVHYLFNIPDRQNLLSSKLKIFLIWCFIPYHVRLFIFLIAKSQLRCTILGSPIAQYLHQMRRPTTASNTITMVKVQVVSLDKAFSYGGALV